MRTDVCIIGGGVIGLTTAYALVKNGVSVTLLESNSDVAQGASFANGAQLSYHYVSPLADEGVLLKGLSWLLKRNAPMTLRPQFDYGQWMWLLRFILSCNRKTNQRNTSKLFDLALLSHHVLQEWRQKESLAPFDFMASGKLVVFRDQKSMDAASKQLVDKKEQHILSATACLHLEPSLVHLSGYLKGGIWTPADHTADCYLFCLSLLEKLKQTKRFRLLAAHRVTGLRYEQGRVLSAKTMRGEIEANHFVLANGVASAKMDLKLPIYPLKGYSLTIAANAHTPQVSLTDFDNKMVYAKIGERLRVAALVDLVGFSDHIDRQRVKSIQELAALSFPDAGDFKAAQIWTGLRPATPTGVPILGKTKACANLYLNVGHGALGFTLACASATLVAQQIMGQDGALNIAQYAG